MVTFSHEDCPKKGHSKRKKRRKRTMAKLGNAARSVKEKSGHYRKSSEGLRRLEPNGRAQPIDHDVSEREPSAFSPRPLPPLLKNYDTNDKSIADISSKLHYVGSKRKLPPIKRYHQGHSSEKHGNDESNFHPGNWTSQDQVMSETIPLAEDEDTTLLEEKFIPLRVSTPTNSKTILRRSTNRLTFPKPSHVTFQQCAGDDPQEDNLSSSVTKSTNGRTLRYDSSFSSDTDYGGDFNLSERRKLSLTKARQWLRSSDFTIKTLDNVPSSADAASDQTVSSIPFEDSRYHENRTKSTSMEQLRKIVSNMQPPDLPCKIVVHERVSKFHIDLLFRLQHFRDWWSDLRLPRLPKITIGVDFARTREAVRSFCVRLRNSLRYPPPIILDPPPRFIIIPPSGWNLHQVPKAKTESNEQSLQLYNRKMSYRLQGDVALLADDDAVRMRSQSVGAAIDLHVQRHSDSTAHDTLGQERQGGTIDKFKRRRRSSSSHSTKNERRSLPKLRTSLKQTAEDSEIKLSSARERLAHILKKLDDPSWFGTWIAKHDEMERDLKRLSKKKLDLIRALTFTVESEPCQKTTVLGHLQDAEDDAEKRRKMRVHQQYAHHRFGMSTIQPSANLSPVLHADARALGSEDMPYCSKFTPPMYTDGRPGCIACRVMKAARRYGCEDRLSQLSVQPTGNVIPPLT